jgi:hypothetical protein
LLPLSSSISGTSANKLFIFWTNIDQGIGELISRYPEIGGV